MKKFNPKILVLNHCFYPDDVVSARLFGDFCEELSVRGWDVEVMPSNREYRNETNSYVKFERWGNIHIRRIWRPHFGQTSFLGRILNAVWMILVWSSISLRRKNKPDVVLVGTEPILSVLTALAWKFFSPSTRIVHWCFDLHPESAIADGILKEKGILLKIIRYLLKHSYNYHAIIADIGCCMRRLLDKYEHNARSITLIPWALLEPSKNFQPELTMRKELFGDSSMGILYSGNFGLAHSYEDILSLARMLRNADIHFTFGVRGNRVNDLKNAVSKDDTNISFAGFAPESELHKRLTAADIHLVTLKAEWAGIVIPSKFFGSLAAGRPVIFCGPRESAISKWIDQYKVGWVLDETSIENIVEELKNLSINKAKLTEIQDRCFEIYQSHFSKSQIMNQWDQELRSLLE